MSKSGKLRGQQNRRAASLGEGPGPMLHQAIARVQSGDPNAAIRICRALIRDFPSLFDAHHILGFALAAKGDFHAALDAYAVALPLQPNNAELLNNMGIASGQVGALVQAIAYYDQALAFRPDYADALMNRGAALGRQGRWDEALVSLVRAAQVRPDHPDTITHLGLTLNNLGRAAEAEALLRDGLKRYPKHADLGANLAGVLVNARRMDEAIEIASSVLASDPDHVVALVNRSAASQTLGRSEAAVRDAERVMRREPLNRKAWHNLVCALEDLGRFDEAQQHILRFDKAFPDDLQVALRAGSVLLRRDQAAEALPLLRRVVEQQPSNIEALAKLGTALIKTRDLVGAYTVLSAAAKLAPDNQSIRNNLAVASLLQQDTARAILTLRRALRTDPNNPDILANIAYSYMRWGRFAQAESFLARSRAIRPDHADTRWNGSLLRLLHGDFEAGWDLYEARRFKDFWRPRSLSGPEFPDLEAMRGKRLFLYSEQGLGDTIQFARYAEILAEYAASVELEVQPPLVGLIRGLRGVKVIGFGDTPSPYDGHLPLMSAPRLLGTRLETIPARTPYLTADPTRVVQWAQSLGAHGFKIGIAWQGNPHGAVDQGRSFPLRFFEPLAHIPGVRLISLQKNSGLEQLAALPPGMIVETLGDGFDAGDQAFLDSAAVMAHLDLVITSDTSVAHLAGALGRPVWVALKYAPDWRWLLEREDSPWYPTVKLFRQSKPGDWQGVFQRIFVAVKGELEGREIAPVPEKPAAGSTPISAAESDALSAMSEGRFERVVSICEKIVSSGRASGLVHYMTAFAYAQLGRHTEALQRFEDAARLIPRADVFANWALSLNVLGRYAEGLRAANDALAAKSDFPSALVNRAQALLGLERFDEALSTSRLVVEKDPSSAPGWTNLAAAFNGLCQHFEALEASDRAIEIDPGLTAARDNRAIALAGLGRHADALAIWDDLLAEDPSNTSFLRASVRSLIVLGQAQDALDRAEAALLRGPEHDPEILAALASARVAARMYQDALGPCEMLLARNPRDWQVQSIYGSALLQCGRANEAQKALSIARELRPSDLDVQRNLAHVALLRADFGCGWDLYEGRRKRQTPRTPALVGSEISSRKDVMRRRVFLYAEQGLGDTIQFARYAELLAREAGSVELEVQAPLVALLGGLRGVRVIGAGATPSPYDGHLPLMSAPRLMGTRLDTIPADIPYVSADPLRVSHWAERIGSEGFKIGIAWQGNALSAADEGRSVPVGMFAGIGRIPGVRLISLQKNDGLEQLVDAPKELKIETLGDDFDAGQHAFLDTAAVMAHLDLVISCDTAIAHLAGAMGRPTWIALRHAPDWRWLLDRDDSPWYPTARLFRQPAPGDWRTVFDNIAQAVAAEVGEAWSDEYRLTEGQPANDHMASLAEARLNLGDAAGAIEICQAALEGNPGSFQARYVLAVALSASGRREEAIPHFKSSLDLRPRDVSLRVNYANTLNGVSRYEDALDVLEARPTGSSLLPVWLDAHAIASWGLGAFERALNDWREAIELAPHQNAFRLNWALSLYRQRRFREAVDVLTPLLQAHPDHEGGVNLQIQCLLAGQDVAAALAAARGAHQRLPRSPPIARALAACLIEDGAHSEAMDILTASTAAADASADVDLLIGKIHDRASEWSKAADAYAKALAKQPNLFPARLGLGVAQGKLGDHAAALESIIQAVELDPKDASALVQLGIARQNVGDWDGARKEFNEVSRLYPNNADVAWNCALHHLTMGDLKRGFDLYEARRHRSGAKLFRTPSGEEAKLRLQTIGKRIFLHAEQGLGDTIQFARYAELLAADALSVELEVQAPIVSLLSRLKGVRVIPAGASASEYDLHAPLMSLPRLFATRLETIPASVPYLFAEPERMAHWAQRLGPQGFKIAIAWQGSSFGAVDEGRSIPLRMFQAVSGIPGVRLISIQKNFGVEQLSVLSASMAVETLGPDFDAGGQAFLDTAAVMAHADLVITSDTSIAHLAGAMGRPVWIALKFSPDWRWFLERPDSPWYPTARLFRQPKPGDWESVFGEIAKEVQKVMNRR